MSFLNVKIDIIVTFLNDGIMKMDTHSADIDRNVCRVLNGKNY